MQQGKAFRVNNASPHTCAAVVKVHMPRKCANVSSHGGFSLKWLRFTVLQAYLYKVVRGPRATTHADDEQ